MSSNPSLSPIESRGGPQTPPACALRNPCHRERELHRTAPPCGGNPDRFRKPTISLSLSAQQAHASPGHHGTLQACQDKACAVRHAYNPCSSALFFFCFFFFSILVPHAFIPFTIYLRPFRSPSSLLMVVTQIREHSRLVSLLPSPPQFLPREAFLNLEKTSSPFFPRRHRIDFRQTHIIIIGGHSKQDRRHTQKPVCFPIFTNTIWYYLLRPPVIAIGALYILLNITPIPKSYVLSPTTRLPT